MKFLCDRCKTRYSIGDERVRGKILKIRCKNCNNVITVREGMPEIGAEDAKRNKQPTQAIEAVRPGTASGTAANGALGAAFASAMTKPPPALEEEWYVSIDGDQAGPFSLTEAQRWVSSKAFDAELHCWSEGFDDWLPVDKVSHFRGLRKKPAAPPAPAAPPPLPRAATAAHRAVTRPVEEEPKPLFAATMASLEKSTQPPLGSGNFPLPAAAPAPAPSTPVPSLRGTPMGGHPAMPGTNGTKTPVPAKPVFDASDSATQIESPPFADEAPAKADPFAAKPKPDPFAAKPKVDPFAGKPAPRALDLTQPVMQDDIDGDLDIGEVSRVVKLADIAKSAPRASADRAQPVAGPVGRSSGTIPALGRTGSITALNRTGSAASIPTLNRTGSIASIQTPVLGPDGRQIDPQTGEPIPLAPQVAVSHRRGMIALIVGAILLLGAAGAVVFMITSEDDGGSGGGLSQYDINTMRPDDPRRINAGSGTQVADKEPSNPFVPKKRPPTYTPPIPTPPTNPDAKALRPDEIEEMAGKYSGTTQTCYRRSQRGAEAIILADLKRLGVTLTVDAAGTVTNVTLSDHAQTSLGKCLISSIKGWKFRQSTAGITARITLVFQGV